MRSSEILVFNASVGADKVQSIIDQNNGSCPFCNYKEEDKILARKGEILLVKNKYPILQDTFPTVLIECNDCQADISTYPKAHLYSLFRFAIGHWLEMDRSGLYKSVIFFKNHGPNSGGTMRHPHMQIIGLKNLDYLDFGTTIENFTGLLIDKQPQVELNLSTSPRMGFYEFNVVLDDLAQINRLSDYIQDTVHFLLNYYHRCDSYNIFFYKIADRIYAKIIPRFVTSPMFVGYSIPQITTRLEDVARSIKERYYSQRYNIAQER